MRKKLLCYRRQSITLDQLEAFYFTERDKRYDEFGTCILELEREGVLEEVRSLGRNQKNPCLAYKYRISKHLLNKDFHLELSRYRMIFHEAITLDSYFAKNAEVWQKDLPYLLQIDSYLKNNGFPEKPATAAQRSFEIVANEKWIEQLNGKELLTRIGLWIPLLVQPFSDPLMLAINPLRVQKEVHRHLIVENKATYQGLVPVLMETSFSTLIWGSGNKINGNFENFTSQYAVKGEHHFYYFGDLDRSGISIWHKLQEQQSIPPALPFYEACLNKVSSFGKDNQRKDAQALDQFLLHFSHDQNEKIRKMLDEGKYIPQEALCAEELQGIWRDAKWKA